MQRTSLRTAGLAGAPTPREGARPMCVDGAFPRTPRASRPAGARRERSRASEFAAEVPGTILPFGRRDLFRSLCLET